MSTKCSSEPSPVAFWFLCRHGQRNSPPAGGEILCENHQERRVQEAAPYEKVKNLRGGGGKPRPAEVRNGEKDSKIPL